MCHLSAQHGYVTELYSERRFSDVLAHRWIKSGHVTGFEAAVALLAAAAGVRGLSSYLAMG